MESCLAGKPERVGAVEVDDIRRDLLGEFSALPAQVSPHVWADVQVVMILEVFGADGCSSHQDAAPSQSENLQVFLRVRPFTSAESDAAESQVSFFK